MRYGPRCRLLAILALLVLAGIDLRAAAAPQEGAAGPEEPAVLGAPTAFDLSGELTDQVRVAAGDRLHAAPAARAPVLARFAAAVDLPVLERRGAWVQVRYGSWRGWVRAGRSGDEEGHDETEEAAPPTTPWTAPAGADPAHVERARALLKAERRLSWGPYDLYTDVAREALLAVLGAVAVRLPEAFARRYALAATGVAREAVVLYARDAAYRDYAAGHEDLAELDSSGHAVGGLAVLAVGERHRDEVRGLLVHELTHLLTYRILGPRLPPWLAEGLAEDLAYCRVAASGELELATLDAWRAMRAQTVVSVRGRPESTVVRSRGGPELALAELRERWRQPDRPALELLLGLPHLDFMDPDRRPIHYPMSAFLVRYLLASEDRAERFRAFLAAVARGEEGGGGELLAHLGSSWEELEAGLGEWLFSRDAARPPPGAD